MGKWLYYHPHVKTMVAVLEVSLQALLVSASSHCTDQHLQLQDIEFEGGKKGGGES